MSNRKAKITKKMFHDAFIELLEDKPLNQISISLLCKKADLNRSTFYAHYETLNDLISEVEEEIISNTPIISYSSTPKLKDIKALTKYYEENRDASIVLIRNGLLTGKMQQSSISWFMKRHDEDPAIFEFLSAFCNWGSSQALLLWAAEKKLPDKEVTSLLYDLFCQISRICEDHYLKYPKSK